ncbi:MAG: S-methyl-5'-thioadenosine phosphorylase, partial [Vicinamibacteria bacterium]
MPEAKVGVIGGSGLYEMDGLADVEEVRLETPFGAPSDKYVLGTLEGKPVAFLARHGIGHRLLPTELNFRANIYGFKVLGVEHILSASAVGSLKEDVHPLDIVIPDQFIDRTRSRISTFFGNGIAAHVEFSHPFCARLSKLLYQASLDAGARVHRGGTYVC